MIDRRNLVAWLWGARSGWLLLAILAGSLALNVHLGWAVRSLSQGRVAPSAVTVGARVPTLTLEDLDRRRVTIDWRSGGRPTLVYVFSPSCHWCTRNLPNIKSLTSGLNAKYRILGISLSGQGLTPYVKDNGLAFPVYTNPTEANGRPFVLAGTPQTLIIALDGTVQEAWRGAYAERVKKDIEAKLGVELPGMAPDPQAADQIR